MFIELHLRKEIERSLKAYPVVGIVGSRQTGKTTLARQIQSNIKTKSIYLDLEDFGPATAILAAARVLSSIRAAKPIPWKKMFLFCP